MDIVCASPSAHQFGSVQRIWTSPNAAGDRSGAADRVWFANSVIRRLFDVGASIRVEMRGFSGFIWSKNKKFVPKILFLESLRRTKNSVRGTTQIVLQNQHHSGSHEALDQLTQSLREGSTDAACHRDDPLASWDRA